MFCVKCGKELPEDSTFCGFCGAVVEHDDEENGTCQTDFIRDDNCSGHTTYCGYCGKEISIEEIFCPFCGSRLDATVEIQPNNSYNNLSEANGHSVTPKNKKRTTRITIIIVAIVALVMIAAAAYFFLLKDDAKESDATQITDNNQQTENTFNNDSLNEIPDSATEYNGHYYEIVNEGMCWSTAREVCEEKGGHLVYITSQEEENFIESLIENNRSGDIYHYWLGATDEDEEGVWKWLDGEQFWQGGPVEQGGFSVGGMYQNWLPSQPNNSVKETDAGQDYLEIQVTKGNEGPEEYLTWTDITDNGVAYGYEGADDYNDTRYYGYICEWDK